MHVLRAEWEKHRSFREVWVGYALGAAYLLLALFNEKNSVAGWFGVQQNIRTYGSTLIAFLTVVGISRLLCYEKERKTDGIIRTCKHGLADSFQGKMLLTIEYCAAAVLLVGAISILVNGFSFRFESAFSQDGQCMYFSSVPINNLFYCVIQYVFLFLGALYFAGFILIIAALVKRSALVIFICGGCYAAFMFYYFAGFYWIQGTWMNLVFDFLFRYGFSGFLLQESYSRLSGGAFALIGDWTQIWKPVLYVLLMIAAEFFALWLLWRCKAKK